MSTDKNGESDPSQALQKLQSAKQIKDQNRGELIQTIRDLMAMGQKMNKRTCQLEQTCQDEARKVKTLEDTVKSLTTEKEALKSESKACSKRLEAQVRELKSQLFTEQGKSEMLEDEIQGLRSALAKLSDL